MSELEPLTREEQFLDAIADNQDPVLEPLTREEHFLNAIATGETPTLTPMTREEYFLNKIATSEHGGGGGGDSDFTTAVFTNNYQDNLEGSFFYLPTEEDYIVPTITTSVEIYKEEYVVPLYKGSAVWVVALDPNDIIISGDAEYDADNWFLIITGDATLQAK